MVGCIEHLSLDVPGKVRGGFLEEESGAWGLVGLLVSDRVLELVWSSLQVRTAPETIISLASLHNAWVQADGGQRKVYYLYVA